MDPGTLRLILFVLGIGLIASIYLWERRRELRIQRRERQRLLEEQAAISSDDGETQDVSDDDFLKEKENAGLTLSSHLDELEKFVRHQEGNNAELGLEVPGEKSSAQTPADTRAAEPDDHDKEVLVFSIVSRRKYFSGDAILSAMRSMQLQSGDKNIFYRYAPDNVTVLYGIANLVEPGYFPLDDMRRFTTSGISMFATLPSVLSGKEIFNDMHRTAEKLAAFLDGVIHDSSHQPMTDEELEHMRKLAYSFDAI